MNWLHNLPLKRRLTLVILLTLFQRAAARLWCAGRVYQIFNFRQNMVHDTTVVLADVLMLAENTRAAMAFQDDNAAGQT